MKHKLKQLWNKLKQLWNKLKTAKPDKPHPAPVANPFSLDTPLLQISPYDAYTIRDACEHVQIFGQSGAGKSSGPGKGFGKAFLHNGFGGVVMCAKTDERALWERYAAETNRTADLIIISPDTPHRFNFLEYELRRQGPGGGYIENLVNLFTVITEIAEGKVSMAGGDRFWVRAMNELLRAAISLLKIARNSLSVKDIVNLIATAPQYQEQVAEEWWQQSSFCAQLFREADEKSKTPLEVHEFDLAARYWLKTYPTLGDRTRSSIVATFTSVADMLLHEFAWELFCTDITIVPEMTYRNGSIIVLDLPIQEYGEVGRICQGIFKIMWQRAILRRNVAEHPRPVFLWGDESQNYVSSYDFRFLAEARSARASTVYLTQNISNYYAVLGSTGRDETNALLGNFGTKIFTANTDAATNKFAADIIAQDWTTVQSGNIGQSDGANRHSTGWSQALQYKVLPVTFTTLRKGGPLNQWNVEGIMFQGGRLWNANGETFIKVTFRQDRKMASIVPSCKETF